MNSTELFYYVAIINAALLVGVITLFVAKLTNAPFWKSTEKHLKKKGLHYAFWATALSSVGSLWLSEIAGITPCFLCWMQRAFMYPLAIYLGLKIFKKENFYPTVLAITSTILLYVGIKVLPSDYLSLYAWYAFTMSAPLAIYFVFKHTAWYSEKRYALILAIVGAVIALYHYGVQRIGFLQKTIACTADASCATMYLGYWGWYSIPLMAFVGFAVAAFTLWHIKK
jgi:disulfide bond formation protein DsbB